MLPLFDLDDEGVVRVNDALLEHAGQAIDDIKNERALSQE